jgi:LysR family transcriptional regulator, glycine cleavage system transcriptional activator
MPAPDLPPLTALRAFDAVARRSSFKAAAEDLFVTPTAISHQIRQLEAHLSVRVLNRTARAVTLTAEGRVLYAATASGFAEIAKAVALLRQRQDSTVLTLSSTTAFLSLWIVPRLNELQQLLADVDLRLHASDSMVELQSGGVEVAVRYGKGPFVGAATVRLRDDVFGPVCSPGLGISKLKDLRRAALIHIDGRRVPSPPPDWVRWCSEAGLSGVDTRAGVRFPDSTLAVQASIAGHGVAIVSLVLVADALAAGLLVAPFTPVLRGETYHFACATDLETRPHIVTLRNWFLRVMRGSREPTLG